MPLTGGARRSPRQSSGKEQWGRESTAPAEGKGRAQGGRARASLRSCPGRDGARRQQRVPQRTPSRPGGEGGRRDGTAEAGLQEPLRPNPMGEPSSPRLGRIPLSRQADYRCRGRRVLPPARAGLAARSLRRHLPAVWAPARSAVRSRVAEPPPPGA